MKFISHLHKSADLSTASRLLRSPLGQLHRSKRRDREDLLQSRRRPPMVLLPPAEPPSPRENPSFKINPSLGLFLGSLDWRFLSLCLFAYLLTCAGATENVSWPMPPTSHSTPETSKTQPPTRSIPTLSVNIAVVTVMVITHRKAGSLLGLPESAREVSPDLGLFVPHQYPPTFLEITWVTTVVTHPNTTI